MMRAVRVLQFGGPEVLQVLSDIAVPKLSSKQVLIRVHAAGVNPVDTYLRSGAYSSLPSLPYTPGKDSAGIIENVGSDVTTHKVGDRVYTVKAVSGSYAEYCVADDSGTFPLPDNLTFQQGAAIGTPYFTAYRAYKKSYTKPGEIVLIHGASGAVGLACCQIFNAYGCTVYGTAGTENGMKLVQQNGAEKVFNHRSDNYAEAIKAETGTRGPDVIIEMLANVNLEKDLQLLAFNGRIVVVGSRGAIEINPRHTMAKEATVTGVALLKASESEIQEYGSALNKGMECGWIRPVVAQELPLDEVQQAHREVIEHTSGSLGKIVLKL